MYALMMMSEGKDGERMGREDFICGQVDVCRRKCNCATAGVGIRNLRRAHEREDDLEFKKTHLLYLINLLRLLYGFPELADSKRFACFDVQVRPEGKELRHFPPPRGQMTSYHPLHYPKQGK